MFCGKCGNQIPDGVAFCPNCGNATGATHGQAQTQAQTQEQPAAIPEYYAQGQFDPYSTPAQTYEQTAYDPYSGAYSPAPRKRISKNTVIGIAAVAVVVLALVVAAILIFGGGRGFKSPEKAAMGFISSMAELDSDKVANCFPDEVLYEIAEEEFDDSVKDMKKELKEAFEDLEDDGYSIKCKLKVTGTHKYGRDDLNILKKDYEYEGIDISISEAQLVKLKLTVTGEIDGEEIDESFDIAITTIKVGKKWYVDENYAGDIWLTGKTSLFADILGEWIFIF